MDKNVLIIALGAALYLVLRGPIARATNLQI